MNYLDFLNKVQKACLPGIWSKGVALARSQGIKVDSKQAQEIILRVREANHPVSQKVTLWPEDEDWYCDCEARVDVCQHVAAAVISLKNPLSESSVEAPEPSKATGPQLVYYFKRNGKTLIFERWVIHKDQKQILQDTLVSWMGGVTSGRIQSSPLSVTREDYAVDYALGTQLRKPLDRSTFLKLFKALEGCHPIFFEDQPITVSSKPLEFRARLADEGEGFRLHQIQDATVTEAFENGAVLCGSVLKGVEIPYLTFEEQELLKGEGHFFQKPEAVDLVSRVLPSLQKKMPVEIVSKALPSVRRSPPKIVIQLKRVSGGEALEVLPVLTYEQPQNKNEIILSDPVAEKALIRKLQHELQLVPGQKIQIEGEAAVDFALGLKGWEVVGDGVHSFSLQSELVPSLNLNRTDFGVSFFSGSKESSVDAKTVFRAWQSQQSYVPLVGGGWAPLPQDWLDRYGKRILSLLELKESQGKLPQFAMPELGNLCEELGQTCPSEVQRFNQTLMHLDQVPKAPLPEDLKISLRSYQQVGVNWLTFLRENQMGAMLADDMGLGKTLQALCAIRGRTLIVAPASVVHSWAEQIRQFRPSLSFLIYHGSQRKIESNYDVILTTYSLLRLDQEILLKENWDTLVLDEAQVIKNPDSQVARAAHRLQAQFKMTLSGTPIENRLDDLWSQFHFLNPGLLGTRSEFQERFVSPILKGDSGTALRLKEKIRPFILRRLKREVAQELPPKTEEVLYCELNSEEKETYQSLLASTRKEVLEKLEMGGSVFAALELLLRLRQACCHISLVPGQKALQSSKLELLLQTLEESIKGGHRALVFSQWTSYLDLIESALQSQGISFSRLDGSTRNRDEVVREFQKESGPQVMLISLKAGGVGLTLTAADHIFLMDPWWNPAVEEQASDRAHRIGQQNPVLVYRLIAQDTIEDKILALQKMKVRIADAVLNEGSPAGALTRDDLMMLLA